jgi:hypothetical protein
MRNMPHAGPIITKQRARTQPLQQLSAPAPTPRQKRGMQSGLRGLAAVVVLLALTAAASA